jgi:hypothetical protein
MVFIEKNNFFLFFFKEKFFGFNFDLEKKKYSKSLDLTIKGMGEF